MLSVVIPCYNEAEAIEAFESELFPSLDALSDPYEVIAVDDGSRDKTAEVLRHLAGRSKQLRVMSHESNLGLGAALRTGLAAAQGAFTAFLDADMTFHPRHLSRMLDAQRVSNADCISGSPLLLQDSRRIPWTRRLPSLAMNVFYRILLDRRCTSFTPMFRLYRTSALRATKFQCDGFEVSVEILAAFLREGRRVEEVPVELTARTRGESKLRRLRELKNHAFLAWRLMRRP